MPSRSPTGVTVSSADAAFGIILEGSAAPISRGEGGGTSGHFAAGRRPGMFGVVAISVRSGEKGGARPGDVLPALAAAICFSSAA